MLPVVVLVIAIFLVAIGVVKTVLATLALTIGEGETERIKQAHSAWGVLLNSDSTAAGKTIDVIILVIGVYTLLHGLVLLTLAPKALRALFACPWTHVVVNTLFGTFCIVFYALVLYTNVRIGKDDDRTDTYKVFGLGGGVLLLAAASLAFVSHNVVDLETPMWTSSNAPFLCISALLFSVFVFECVTLPGSKAKVVDVLTMTVGNVSAML